MSKRRFERVAVLILSIAMLLSSTGIVSSLAANAGETSVASSTVSSTQEETSTSSNVSQEGGSITKPSVEEEGGSLVTNENGDGTVANPYKISNAEDFLKMQEKINLTTSSDKNFVLTSDIDLSGVKADNFTSNAIYSGSLVSVSKALSENSKNVFFVFDGNGHKITGLNVAVSTGDAVALFGYVNSASVIKNLIVSSPTVKMTSASASSAAILVAENNGTISSVTIDHPTLAVSISKNTGLVAAVNNGIISDVTVKDNQTNAGAATAESYTLCGSGVFGAVAGINSGKITSVSALNVGLFIPTESTLNSVYGGIAGNNSGTISNSVSTGNAMGGKASDIVGGVVGAAIAPSGKTEAVSVLSNNYTLVSISSSVWGCAVIGAGGKQQMMTDCYWSSAVSGRKVMSTDYGSGINDISGLNYKTVTIGKTVKVAASDLKNTWGKASFSLSGEFSSDSKGIALTSSSQVASVKGITVDSVGFINYNVSVMLPSTVGAGSGSVTVSQHMSIAVLVVPNDAVGDGSAASPLVIGNISELSMLRYASGINAKLGKDIDGGMSSFAFNGTLDGNGHRIVTNTQIFSSVYGTVKNLKITLTDNISTAALGRAVGAKVSSVSVTLSDSAKFIASSDNTGILFNTVAGASVVDDCHALGRIELSSETVKNIGGFAGIVIGKGAVITNGSSNAEMSTTADKKATGVANFIGTVSADNIEISDCSVAGSNTAGDFAFIGLINTDKISIKNITWSKGTAKNTAQLPVEFGSYKTLDKAQFTEWAFDEGVSGFFTGNNGQFPITLPTVSALANSDSGEFNVTFDASKLTAYVTVSGGKLILHVGRADGVITVKDSVVSVVSRTTGLIASISVSNGLEKDTSGNYIITTGYDLAYVSENIEAYKTAGFVMNSDVDMTEIKGFTPIGGTSVAFAGTFNGNGHTISGLTVSGTAKVGLFGTLSGATVKNIVFKNASVSSLGGYAAVLAGQATANTVISDITIEDSKINSSERFAAILVGSSNSTTDGFAITNIKITNSSVTSSSNYVGAVSGRIIGNAKLTGITIDGFTASGASNIAGVAGFVQADEAVTLSNIKTVNSVISGVTEIGGILGYGSSEVTLENVGVLGTDISTVSSSSAYTVGGIAANFAGSINGASVEGSKLGGGVVGGIVGKTTENNSLAVNKAKVVSSEVSSDGASTVAAGILGVHGSTGDVTISGCSVSEDTVIRGAAVTAGIVGSFLSADGTLTVSDSVSFATIKGCETANAKTAAGVIGRIGASAVNTIKISGVKVAGKISGCGALGGIVGVIKRGDKFASESPVITDCIASVQITPSDTAAKDTAGIIIGAVEGSVISNDNIESAVSDIIISTYFGSVGAYGVQTGITSVSFYDMDKPDGNAISPSVSELKNSDETTVTLTNLPTVNGFSFDAATGWISESDERILVVSGTENTVVLKAQHQADISIVAYYVLDSDRSIRVPVHFRMTSVIRTPLGGEGTASNPYIISNAFELEAMAQYANDNAFFALSEDITFTDSDFEFGGAFYNVGNGIITIGDATCGFKGTFTGLYNGKIHSITGMKLSGNTFGGLFGATDGAVITNLIINDADVTGANYAGVIVGSAKNTTISNITINSAKVTTVETGSLAGSVAGYAENTSIDGVKVNNAQISTMLNGTSATLEAAGGLAGVFSGSVKNTVLDNMTVIGGTVAGGVFGIIRNAEDKVSVTDSKFTAKVGTDVAGGIIGSTVNPLGIEISGCSVGGTTDGAKCSGGVIAEITATDSDYAVNKAKLPLLKNVIIATVVSSENVMGTVIGNVDADIFCDKENAETDVFENVYYSSYQNEGSVFGTEKINSYQNDEYLVTDLNNMKFISGGIERNTLPVGSEFMTLTDESITVAGAAGGFKSLTVGGMTLILKDITSNRDGLVSYNKVESQIKTNAVADENAKVVFVYDNGLSLSMGISQPTSLDGDGTAQSPYIISDAEDFALMMQNGSASGVHYILENDINLTGVSSAESFGGSLDGNGKVIYDFTGSSLFALITGTVKNLGIAGFSVSDESSAAVGALAGVLDGGTVENCFAIADVTANGSNQDAGILLGRMINGATVSSCLTSGRVVGTRALSVGGIVGEMSNARLTNCVSTAYAAGGATVGGIAGNAGYSVIDTVIFGNMVETSDGAAGNIIGNNEENTTKVTNAYFDAQTALTDAVAGIGNASGTALQTSALTALSIDGLSGTKGYPVPSDLINSDSSAKFATGVAFAAMTVRYLSGLNSGTAYNYTEIKADPTANLNAVSLDTSDGLKLTLMIDADYSGAINTIARYANPATTSSVNVKYIIKDSTEDSSLGSKLIGVLLKSKVNNEAKSFDFFTTAASAAKSIDPVSVTYGRLFVNLSLPEGCTFSVYATDEKGARLSVSDKENEGYLVDTGTSKTVVLTFTVTTENETDNWGLRSLWSVIGK